MTTMQVNFNNVRKQAVSEYNTLVNKLNSALCEDTDMTRVVIPVDDLERVLSHLRSSIATIAMTVNPNDPEMQCVLEEGETLEIFNPNDD